MEMLDIAFAFVIGFLFWVGLNHTRFSKPKIPSRNLLLLFVLIFLAYLKFVDLRLQGARPSIESVWYAFNALLGVLVLALPILTAVILVYYGVVNVLSDWVSRHQDSKGVMWLLFAIAVLAIIIVISIPPIQDFVSWWHSLVFGSRYKTPLISNVYERVVSVFTSWIADNLFSQIAAFVGLFGVVVGAIQGILWIIDWLKTHPLLKPKADG
jgi:hypothetical protein